LFSGISPHADLAAGAEVKYHKYYQWVCFVLFLQAALFYIPRYLWKSSEGGKIRMLVQELQVIHYSFLFCCFSALNCLNLTLYSIT
jgi:hypothetical protein